MGTHCPPLCPQRPIPPEFLRRLPLSIHLFRNWCLKHTALESTSNVNNDRIDMKTSTEIQVDFMVILAMIPLFPNP